MNPFRIVRRIVMMAFAVIQAVLIGRILLDLGVLPADGGLADFIVGWSDVLAAPVMGINDAMGGLWSTLGAGEGFNPMMVAALAGWSVVEWLVLRVIGKFALV